MNIQTKIFPVKPLSEKNHIFPNMDTEKKIALIIGCGNAKVCASGFRNGSRIIGQAMPTLFSASKFCQNYASS